MNIAIIASKINLNGAGSNISLNLLAQELCERGHDVKIVTMNIEQPNQVNKSVPYEIYSLSSPEDSKAVALKSLYSKLFELENNTDVFHFFSPIFTPIGGLYRRRGGLVPVIGRLNSYTMFCTNPDKISGECYANCRFRDKVRHDNTRSFGKILNTPRYLYNHFFAVNLSNSVDRLFAISPAIKNIYSKVGIKEEKINVVPNFYDPEFSSKGSTKVNISKEVNRILYVGRLEYLKGVDVLLNSLEKSAIELHVDIVGNGSQRPQLTRKSKTLPSNIQVEFHGWVDHEDLPDYYRQADLFVHPGRWPEPFGRTLLETLQHRVPALVSDIGGPPWVVGEAGFTFENENPNSLHKQLHQITNEESIYKELQYNCKNRIEWFSPDRIITDVINTYHQESSSNPRK